MNYTDTKLDESENLLYTITEVAKLLKINRNFVYTLINTGHIRSIKLGCRKVTRKSLLEFLENYDGLNFDEIMAVKPTK
ncbi:MAG: helix-turn-helix domain-containing protein [Eubacterium sp.]